MRGSKGPEAISKCLLFQFAQVGAMGVGDVQDFFQRTTIANDGESVHSNSGSACKVQHAFEMEGLREEIEQMGRFHAEPGFYQHFHITRQGGRIARYVRHTWDGRTS